MDTQSDNRVVRGAKRVLEVLAMPRDRPRHGLMPQQFHKAFSSDGWTMNDFRAATHFAYRAGWIGLDANLYFLTERGEEIIRKAAPE